jgi:hypothetical protein
LITTTQPIDGDEGKLQALVPFLLYHRFVAKFSSSSKYRGKTNASRLASIFPLEITPTIRKCLLFTMMKVNGKEKVWTRRVVK